MRTPRMEVREREKDCVCEVESGWGNSKKVKKKKIQKTWNHSSHERLRNWLFILYFPSFSFFLWKFIRIHTLNTGYTRKVHFFRHWKVKRLKAWRAGWQHNRKKDGKVTHIEYRPGSLSASFMMMMMRMLKSQQTRKNLIFHSLYSYFFFPTFSLLTQFLFHHLVRALIRIPFRSPSPPLQMLTRKRTPIVSHRRSNNSKSLPMQQTQRPQTKRHQRRRGRRRRARRAAAEVPLSLSRQRRTF